MVIEMCNMMLLQLFLQPGWFIRLKKPVYNGYQFMSSCNVFLHVAQQKKKQKQALATVQYHLFMILIYLYASINVLMCVGNSGSRAKNICS